METDERSLVESMLSKYLEDNPNCCECDALCNPYCIVSESN